MQQQIAVITLGVEALARSRRFYAGGFGWTPVFENDEIIFYQMNGFVLGTWLRAAMNADMGDAGRSGASAFALAHNVPEKADVEPAMAHLVSAGGTLIRPADTPSHGGMRGYVADPDGHVWEIAWNPAWTIDEQGLVTFGA